MSEGKILTPPQLNLAIKAAAEDTYYALVAMVEAAETGEFTHSDTHPLPMARKALRKAQGEAQ